MFSHSAVSTSTFNFINLSYFVLNYFLILSPIFRVMGLFYLNISGFPKFSPKNCFDSILHVLMFNIISFSLLFIQFMLLFKSILKSPDSK